MVSPFNMPDEFVQGFFGSGQSLVRRRQGRGRRIAERRSTVAKAAENVLRLATPDSARLDNAERAAAERTLAALLAQGYCQVCVRDAVSLARDAVSADRT